MLHSKYKNEATFRSEFVRPLLTSLGFVGVAELHGQHEFGKDFVFAELTPFGFMKYHAAVVKHEKSIGQSNSKLILDVQSQIRQAFKSSFRLPESAAEHCVSSVYLFNSGSITDGAKNVLRNEFIREFADNIHFFDGERLGQLDLTVSFRAGQSFLPRLHGLRRQIRQTMLVWESILDSLPRFREGRGSFTRSIDDYLSAPFLTPPLNYDDLNLLMQYCRTIDSINDCYLKGGVRSQSQRESDIASIRLGIAEAQPVAARILRVVEYLMTQFVPISELKLGLHITDPANGTEWRRKHCRMKGTFERPPGDNVIAITKIGDEWWPQPWPIRIVSSESNQWETEVDFGVPTPHEIYIVRANEATMQLIHFYHQMVRERVSAIQRVSDRFSLNFEDVRVAVSPLHWSLKMLRLPDGFELEDSITLNVCDLAT